MSLHDIELWTRLLAGDPSSLEEIAAEYAPAVSAWLEHKFEGGLPYGESEDVMQETLLALWMNCAKFNPARGKLPAWFAGIAHHIAFKCVNDGCAQERCREELRDPEELDVLPWGCLEIEVGRAADEAEAGNSETNGAEYERSARRRLREENLLVLAEILAVLSEKECAALLARMAADDWISCRELADRLGLKPGAFRVRLTRARHKIDGECARRGLPPPNWSAWDEKPE